jgi:type II secretory pathway predicted ATPase ExeA
MYEQHFGFLEPPFSVTPDPRFFYTNSFYQEAFATLRYGIESRKGFILITGEAGTGKTTLLRRFMRNVESTVHTAFIFNPHLDLNELLRLILNDLGIACFTDDKLTMMAQLNDFLIEQLRKDHVVSLLIDEAQNLSDEMLEELRLLSNLETDREKLIQIVLMGQPELERNLERQKLRQLKQRVALRCRLAPLEYEEVGPYIYSRLEIAGYSRKELFAADAIKKIAAYSKGIPRLINVLSDNALLIAYAGSQTKVSAKIIDEAAQDLRLREGIKAKPSAPANGFSITEKSANGALPFEARKNQSIDEPWLPNLEEFAAGFEKEAVPQPNKGKGMGMGVGTLMAAVVFAITSIFYAQQSRSLESWRVNIENLVGVRWESAMQAPSLPPPSETGSLLSVRRASESMLNGYHQTSRAPAKAQSGPPAKSRDLNGESTAPANAAHSELSLAEPKQSQVDSPRAKTKERSSGTFRVVNVSFVRDRPRADANITASLEPGSRIRVQSKTGDYFRVRSLDKEPISGYVHREDAFFEPAK